MDQRERLAEVARRSIEELGRFVVPWEALTFNEPGEKKEPKAKAENRPGAWLPEDAFMVLVRIIRRPEETLDERWTALDWDRNRELRAREVLQQKGLIKSAGKIGKWVFFELTEKGKAWAETRGIDIPSYKSGTLHEIERRLVIRGFRLIDGRIRSARPKPINGVQLDGLMLFPENRSLGIQVCHMNRPECEADCLVKLAEDPWLDRVLLVALQAGKVEAISKKVEELRGTEWAGWSKVVLLRATEVLKPGFDWRSIVGDLLDAS